MNQFPARQCTGPRESGCLPGAIGDGSRDNQSGIERIRQEGVRHSDERKGFALARRSWLGAVAPSAAQKARGNAIAGQLIVTSYLSAQSVLAAIEAVAGLLSSSCQPGQDVPEQATPVERQIV